MLVVYCDKGTLVVEEFDKVSALNNRIEFGNKSAITEVGVSEEILMEALECGYLNVTELEIV